MRNNKVDDHISAVARAEAARNRLTQADVAVALGVSRSAYAARLRGETHWAASELPQLADVFGVSVSDLMGDGE